MEIIKIVNPKNGSPKSIISLSEYDKNAIKHVVAVLSEICDTTTTCRDKFEFEYAQKFLNMICNLQDPDEITNKIDEILIDEDFVKFTENEQKDIENIFGKINEIIESMYPYEPDEDEDDIE